MGTGLSPRQMHRLDLACAPIREVFVDGKGPFTDLYLVGSAVKGDNSAGRRDVDVRLMLDAPEYAALVETVGIQAIRFLGIAIGDHLAVISGLPIDFQIQQTQEANDKHGGGYRNPLGFRSMANFIGDGEPTPCPACGSRQHQPGQFCPVEQQAIDNECSSEPDDPQSA